MNRKRKKKRPIPRKQLEECKGCVWGRWDGVKQLFSRPKCPRFRPSLMGFRGINCFSIAISCDGPKIHA